MITMLSLVNGVRFGWRNRALTRRAISASGDHTLQTVSIGTTRITRGTNSYNMKTITIKQLRLIISEVSKKPSTNLADEMLQFAKQFKNARNISITNLAELGGACLILADKYGMSVRDWNPEDKIYMADGDPSGAMKLAAKSPEFESAVMSAIGQFSKTKGAVEGAESMVLFCQDDYGDD